MQIAAASSQEGTVDRHFGNTQLFGIYETEGDSLRFVKTVKVTPFSSGKKVHDFDQTKFDPIHSALEGCERLYCVKIGEKPKKELLERGIEAIEYDGLIEEIKI